MDKNTENSLLAEAIKRSGDEEVSKKLIEVTKDLVDEYFKFQGVHLSNYIKDMGVKTEEISKTISDKSKKESTVTLFHVFIENEIVAALLIQAAEIAAFNNTRMPLFIGAAAQMYEDAMLRSTKDAMTSFISEMFLSRRPEVPKDKMS